ncbi:MAG: hypothetical protein M1837_006295 [Sclerophora amabilis]|nr:MAG: hypothetical protein M1837_006295 [Sclerophora amabilis]
MLLQMLYLWALLSSVCIRSAAAHLVRSQRHALGDGTRERSADDESTLIKRQQPGGLRLYAQTQYEDFLFPSQAELSRAGDLLQEWVVLLNTRQRSFYQVLPVSEPREWEGQGLYLILMWYRVQRPSSIVPPAPLPNLLGAEVSSPPRWWIHGIRYTVSDWIRAMLEPAIQAGYLHSLPGAPPYPDMGYTGIRFANSATLRGTINDESVGLKYDLKRIRPLKWDQSITTAEDRVVKHASKVEARAPGLKGPDPQADTGADETASARADISVKDIDKSLLPPIAHVPSRHEALYYPVVHRVGLHAGRRDIFDYRDGDAAAVAAVAVSVEYANSYWLMSEFFIHVKGRFLRDKIFYPFAKAQWTSSPTLPLSPKLVLCSVNGEKQLRIVDP